MWQSYVLKWRRSLKVKLILRFVMGKELKWDVIWRFNASRRGSYRSAHEQLKIQFLQMIFFSSCKLLISTFIYLFIDHTHKAYNRR